jgi:hypothetical protein
VIGAARQRDCLIALADGIDEAVGALPIAGDDAAAQQQHRLSAAKILVDETSLQPVEEFFVGEGFRG